MLKPKKFIKQERRNNQNDIYLRMNLIFTTNNKMKIYYLRVYLTLFTCIFDITKKLKIFYMYASNILQSKQLNIFDVDF